MHKNLKRLLIALLVITILVATKSFNFTKYINFQSIKENREYFYILVQQHYWLSVFIYMIVYITVCILLIPVSILLTILGGFLFGVFAGLIYADIAATIGATIIFLLFRHLLGNFVQQKYKAKLSKFNKNIDKYGATYLIIMRILALPFFLENVLVSLTRIPLKTFVIATFLGMIPGSLVYTYAGTQLRDINSLSEIFSPKIILAFALLILSAIFALFFQKYYKHNNNY